MKLKTLKDIKGEGEGHNKDCCKRCIREEAIKWDKYYESLKIIIDSNIKVGKINNMIMEAKKNVLIEFHNITEDDLKWKKAYIDL